ncbi:MAG: winged helix-turn-helix domain-containing protein [Terracidiphilus sp.]|nr:winged helix-turn-helix domain-containing protein [Terracidiphilus sp.]
MKHASLSLPDLQESEFVFAGFRLGLDGTLLKDGRQVHLPPKELAALRLLLEHAGQIVTPQQLKIELWGDVHVTADSVPRCVSSLRTALLSDDIIQTVYKKGYRLTVAVQQEPVQKRDVPPRLAVLPFAGGLMVPTHLGAAVAEETLVRLCRNFDANAAPFTVIARDSVFTLALKGFGAVQIGRTLHADLVLTGTLRAQMAGYRLRAEIIRVRDEAQLWVEDFQVPTADYAALEHALAERLAIRLGIVFQPEHAAVDIAASGDSTGNAARLEAWNRFQRGHQDLYSTASFRLQDGLQNLLRATELDPTLLQAQIDLIHLCLKESTYGFLSPAVAAEQVRRAARSIPRGNPASINVLPALGWLRFHMDRNLPGALRAFDESAHLPHDQWTTRWRVAFALSLGHWEQASELLESALRHDPFSPWLHASLGWCWHLARQPQKSLAQIERTLGLFDPDEYLGLYGVIILAYNGHAAEAVSLADRISRTSPNCDLIASSHAYALACAERPDDALSIMERLQWFSRERYVATALNPAAYLQLGSPEAAINDLRAAEESRCPWFFQILADPRLDSLREHPEVQRMQASLATLEASMPPEPFLRKGPGLAKLVEVIR